MKFFQNLRDFIKMYNNEKTMEFFKNLRDFIKMYKNETKYWKMYLLCKNFLKEVYSLVQIFQIKFISFYKYFMMTYNLKNFLLYIMSSTFLVFIMSKIFSLKNRLFWNETDKANKEAKEFIDDLIEDGFLTEVEYEEELLKEIENEAEKDIENEAELLKKIEKEAELLKKIKGLNLKRAVVKVEIEEVKDFLRYGLNDFVKNYAKGNRIIVTTFCLSFGLFVLFLIHVITLMHLLVGILSLFYDYFYKFLKDKNLPWILIIILIIWFLICKNSLFFI